MYNNIGLLQTEATQDQYILCFLLVNAIFLITYILKDTRNKNVVSWILLLIFCVFAPWDPDYFSFAEGFYTSLKDFRDPLYYYISQISLGSYSIFRFIIWGLALFLLHKTIKRFNIHKNTALFIFSISYLALFAQMRGSLGLVSYCYGLSLLLMNNNNNRSTTSIIGILFIGLSYFGHRGMIVPILLTPLIFLKPKRIYILALMIVGITLAQIAESLLSSISTGELVLNANSALSGAEEGLVSYAKKESVVTYNWKYTLTTELRRHTYTVLFIYCLWMCFFSKKRDQLSDSIKRLMLVCCGLFSIGISFVLVGNLGSILMGERFLFYLGVPLCIVLTHIREKRLCRPSMFYLVLLPGFLFIELFIFGKILSF